ncbi:M50 family metallopeptidase [Ferrimonas kyonanensis]|uniref:M50 family metallopeptidase n=1 Tax=Ferrimonas kyonanensis TaxID=364763 RepID=UPI0005587E16|nr:M50 family metallopeptidase [Ferrimonas kyonanensis]
MSIDLLLTLLSFAGISLLCRAIVCRLGYLGRWVFSVPGVIVHELGHFVFALLFGHRVRKVVWFKTHQGLASGSVSHQYEPGNLWQRLGCTLVPLGPLFSGAMSMIAIWQWSSLPSPLLFGGGAGAMDGVGIVQLIRGDTTAVVPLILIAAVSSNCWPSRTDWLNALKAGMHSPTMTAILLCALLYLLPILKGTLTVLLISCLLSLILLSVVWLLNRIGSYLLT